jgi:XTP/dITP diphosphohydrolase
MGKRSGGKEASTALEYSESADLTGGCSNRGTVCNAADERYDGQAMTNPAESTPIPQLVLGTANRKKGLELAELLAPYRIVVWTLADLPPTPVVDETGDTFAANAALKATGYATRFGQWVLADDSGLAVDALGGEPGVQSAYFAGRRATDEANNRLLLERLSGVPLQRRSAHYVCHVALADPLGKVRATAEEVCRGRILDTEHGQAGFGYDPLFEIPEYHRTFGELGLAVKGFLSHRARAMRTILPDLLRLLDSGT